MEGFGAATRAWFEAVFAAPTEAQAGAWRAISKGSHALVVAPTGSGKTLAAFLWALDRLAHAPSATGDGAAVGGKTPRGSAMGESATGEGAATEAASGEAGVRKAGSAQGGWKRGAVPAGRSARGGRGVSARLRTQAQREAAQRRCRVLYVSPLKALAVDVERNLRAPLVGIRHTAERLGVEVPEIRVGVRSGDTSPADRRRIQTSRCRRH